MAPELKRHQRKRALFDEAADLPIDQQGPFLDQHCADDPGLRGEIERLLAQENAHAESATGAAIASFHQTISQIFPDSVNKGTQLGAYRVIEQIGAGGMGRVFKAERTESDFKLTVAIKLLRQELINPDLLKRFSAERNLLAALNHPGICRVFDIGSHHDTPYVVMELVEGKPLIEYCDSQRLGVAQRLRLFRKVLSAVSYAHQNLIIHRDLKSSNILADEQGEIKLLDFGIAKALNPSGVVAQTATNDRYLSLGNAAPEQLRGDNLTVACDVYALGTVLYELLCGATPFELNQTSVGALEAQILTVPPQSMTRRVHTMAESALADRGFTARAALSRQLGGDLEAIVQRCLRKEPQARYQSVEQLDQDIGNYLESRPISAVSGQRRYVLRKFMARHRLPVALAGVALLALGLTGGLILARNAEAIRERDRAQQALAILREAFISADPARVAGEEVTVKEVLSAAIPALEKQYLSEPDLYASLASSIGEVQLKIGQSTSAAELLGRASEAAQRASVSSENQFDILVLRARAQHAAGEYQAAMDALAQARELGVALTPEWQVTQAATLAADKQYEPAIDLLLQAIAGMSLRSADDEWANAARLRLAEALQRSGQSERALQVLEDTVVWLGQALDPSHPRVTLARLQLVIQKQQMGQTEKALEDAQDIYAGLTAAYGADSPYTAKAAMVLASALKRDGRSSEAIAMLRAVVTVFRKHLGDNHPNTLRATNNLASALILDQATVAEALALYERNLDGSLSRLGTSSRLVMYFRIVYAEALIEHGAAEKALLILSDPSSAAGIASAADEYARETLKLIALSRSKLGCTQPAGPSSERTCAAAAQLLAQFPELSADTES
ncbi:MAG: protein kinase [Xanthomonadales bacterium]|nr:protein kinase [Xanthomonadales bacterium]